MSLVRDGKSENQQQQPTHRSQELYLLETIDKDIDKFSHRDRAVPTGKKPLFSPCPICGRKFGLEFEDLHDRLDCMQRALAHARGEVEELRLEITELILRRSTDIKNPGAGTERMN